MPLENNRNAYIGMNVESLFKNSIVDHTDIVGEIQEKYGIEGRFLNANKSGITGDKSDVRLSFASGHYIDVNIKAYKIAFNQLTRTTVKHFCEVFNISEQDKAELESLIVNKSKDTKINKLFPDDYQERWGAFFTSNIDKIIKWGFSSVQSREIIALYDRNTSIFRIYPMKNVLKDIKKDIVFTAKGNVDIGTCMSFQRKGGNGSMSRTIPKKDIKHPGNNIQLKLKVNKFVEEMENHLIGKYTI